MAISCADVPPEEASVQPTRQAEFLRATQEPRVRLGNLGAPEAEQFSSVVGAVQLTDGRILVAEGSDREIRVFSRSGEFLGSWGRRGDGPGEFRGMSDLFLLPGDTVGVYDLGTRRYTLFDSRGEFLRISDPHRGLSYTAGFINGDILATYRDFPGGEEGIVEGPPIRVVITSFDGDTLAQIGPFPGSQVYRVVSATSRGQTHHALPLLFSPKTHVSASSHGVWVGHGSTSKIALYSDAGGRVAEVKLPFPRRPATRRDVENLVDREAPPGGSRPENREVYLEMAETVPVPDSLPWYDEMTCDLVRGVWVREYPEADSDLRFWWRLEPGVDSVTRVELPSRLRRVYQLTGASVLGVEFGEFGEPMVVLYDLLPAT